jgi:hypothetical protein
MTWLLPSVALDAGFAGAGLDEIIRADHAHGQEAGGADVVVGFEFADFEDDLQRRLAAGLDHGGDFILHAAEFAGEEGSAIDHHVDFIGSIVHGGVDFGETCFERCLSRWKRRGDGGDLHLRAADVLLRVLHHRRIHTDGSGGGNVTHIMRRERLLAKRGDLARRVLAFQRGQIDHRHGKTQAEDLRLLLDAASRVLRHAFLDADMIDGADLIEQSAEAGGRFGGGHGAEEAWSMAHWRKWLCKTHSIAHICQPTSPLTDSGR